MAGKRDRRLEELDRRGNICESLQMANVGSIPPMRRLQNGTTESALERVEIPSGIMAIGKSAFVHCKALREVVLPEGVTKLDKWAFEDCGRFETLRLPASVAEIGKRAFADCARLAWVELPMGLERVAPDAFAGCGNLRPSPYPTTLEQGRQLATATIAALLAARKGE